MPNARCVTIIVTNLLGQVREVQVYLVRVLYDQHLIMSLVTNVHLEKARTDK